MDRETLGATGASTGRLPRVRATERSLRRLGLWWVGAAFLASRVAAFVAGVRFDDHGVADAWQVIDLELLRHHLAESILHSHTEPPLFNLFIGIVLNWSPLSPHRTFLACFLAMGVVFSVATLDLARSLGVPRAPAIVVTIVIVASPTAILYENWMYPTYPATVLVVVSMAAFARWVRSGALRWLALLTGATAAAVLTLAMVHPVWLLAVVGLAVVARRPARGVRLGAAAVVLLPLLLVGGLVAKNQVRYGSPGLSSWFGMNLARTTTLQADEEELRALIATGRIDPIAAEDPFGPLSSYESLSPPCTRAHPEVPVLSRPEKAGGHGANYNDECYLPIYARYQSAALAMIAADPGQFGRSKVGAAQLTMMPASQFGFVELNRRKISGYEASYDRAVLLTVEPLALLERPRHMEDLFYDTFPFSVTIALSLLVVVGAGVRAARRWRRDGPTASSATLVAIAALTLFVFAVGITFELGENNRFRWLVEPLMLIVLARAAVAAVAWVRTRMARRSLPLSLAAAAPPGGATPPTEGPAGVAVDPCAPARRTPEEVGAPSG